MTEPVIAQQESELTHVLERVKDLPGYGRLKAARELLERALQQYPTNERLLKLHWAVSPGKVERVDVRYSNGQAAEPRADCSRVSGSFGSSSRAWTSRSPPCSPSNVATSRTRSATMTPARGPFPVS